MVSPLLVLQGLHIPRTGDQLIVASTEQNQARAGVAWSTAGLRKGMAVLDLADADCARHEAQLIIDRLLTMGDDLAKLPALRAKTAFLDTRRDEWRQTQDKEEQRFRERIITLSQLSECRIRVSELERKIVQSEGEASRIEARGVESSTTSLQSLAEGYVSSALDYEDKLARVRSSDSWQLRLAGGVVPTTRPVDWYGQVELSFNIGMLFRTFPESRYLESRTTELKEARYELAPRLREFMERARSLRKQAERELAIVESQLSFITKTRMAIEEADSSAVAHSVALLTLDQISSESERNYLSAFISVLLPYDMDAANEHR